MVDVATLALEARTDGLKRAETALNGVTAAASRTEAATDRVAVSARQSSLSMAQLNRSSQGAAGGFQNLGFQIQDFAVQVGAGTSATQALGQQLPQLLSGFGLLGIAIGTLSAVLIPVAGYFLSASSGADALAASTDRVREAQEDLAASSRDMQDTIDKLRFGVDEQFQVELLREQLRLRAEYTTKTTELNGYLATTTDSLDLQRIKTQDLVASITEVANKYNENARLLADQESKAATLAVVEGVRAQRAGEVAAQQAATAAATERQRAAMISAYKVYADTRVQGQLLADAADSAGVSASYLASLGFGNIATAAGWAKTLADNLAAASRNYGKIQNAGDSGPDTARRSVLGLNAPGVIRGVVSSGAAGPSMPGYGGGGGGGGGGGASDGFQSRLDQMMSELQTERETMDAWYAESMEILNDRRAKELLGAEGHAAALVAIERKLAQEKAAIRDGELEHYESFFGSMAGALQSGGGRLLAISKGFALAEAAVSIWRGAAKALELPFPASLAAWGRVIATGARALSGIKSASFGSSGLGGGGVGSSPQAPQQSQRYVRIDVQGDGMFAEQLRANISTIASAFFDEAKMGGSTVVIGR